MYSASEEDDVPQQMPRRQQLEGGPISEVSEEEVEQLPPQRKRKFVYEDEPQRKKQLKQQETISKPPEERRRKVIDGGRKQLKQLEDISDGSDDEEEPPRKRKFVYDDQRKKVPRVQRRKKARDVLDDDAVQYEAVKNEKIAMVEYAIPHFDFDETNVTQITPRSDFDFKYIHDVLIESGYNFTTTEDNVTMPGDVVVHCICSVWSQEAKAQYVFSPETATDVASFAELVEAYKDGLIETGPLPKMKRSKFSQLWGLLAEEFMKVGNKSCKNTRFQEFITRSSQNVPFTPLGGPNASVDCIILVPFVLRPYKGPVKSFDGFVPHRFNATQTAGFVSEGGKPQQVVLWASPNRGILRLGGNGNGSGIMFASGYKSLLAQMKDYEEVRIKAYTFATVYTK